MSSGHILKAMRPSMQGWKGLHVGMVPCNRDKDSHTKWRWGHKKGLRRARRRLGKHLIQDALEGS